MSTVAQPEVLEGWQLLEQSRALVGPRVRDAVEQLAEPVRLVAGYHLGWCDSDGRSTAAACGKGVRGALVLGSAQAVGAPTTHAVDAAAAVELVHNFSVLQDDLMDGDRVRRGRESAWTVFGGAQAIIAGDALLVLALRVLSTQNTDQPRLERSAPLGELCDALLELVAGQSADLCFEARVDVSLQECLTMASGKTASLFGGACALGALAADAEPQRVIGLRAFGLHLGVAFQLVDDMLGIWGDPHATGKPVGADLRRRKKSLPVVAALCSGTVAGQRLAELYRDTTPMTQRDGAEAVHLVEEAGGRHWAQDEAERQRALALNSLESALPEPEGARALSALAALITGRDR